MNTNDIFNALVNNEITPEDVSKAYDLHSDFVALRQKMQEANVRVTTENFEIRPLAAQVAMELKLVPFLVEKFLEDNRGDYTTTTWGLRNKVAIIRIFRDKFQVTLFDAKWAIEMLYDGHSYMTR